MHAQAPPFREKRRLNTLAPVWSRLRVSMHRPFTALGSLLGVIIYLCGNGHF